MVLDSSALVAIIFEEPDSVRLRTSIYDSAVVCIGAPTLLETSMVLTRVLGTEGRQHLDRLVEAMEAEVIPFNEVHERVAFDAFRRYGKGRHPASLNYGDCMTYAIAKVSKQPLLFVGSDFSKTDIV